MLATNYHRVRGIVCWVATLGVGNDRRSSLVTAKRTYAAKVPEETSSYYRSRVLFELRRRSKQLITKFNPFDRETRLERLVGPAGIWPHLQQYQFNALTRLGLKPHHSVVDIGCGPLTVGVP